MILHLLPLVVDGCAYHRIEIPMVNLRGFSLAKSTVLDGIEDEHLKKISLVVMSRDSCIVDIDGQLARLKRFGIPYVLDIDDYWKLNKEHLAYEDFKQQAAPRWIKLMQGAAAVTTTNARLAGKIQFHNKNVIVVPNAIDTSQPEWEYIPRNEPEKIFGWVGGTHHLQDIEILKPVFSKLHAEKLVTLALGGWTIENKVFHIYEHWMSGGPGNPKYKRIRGEDVYNYGRIYDMMDACIVPLVQSKFTACKSSLKLIEAGFKGKPCIVSRVPPYTDDFTDKEVLFCDTVQDWYANIMKLYNNPNLLFDYKQALRESVQRFEIKKVNHTREQLYSQIIQHGRGQN